CLNCCDSPSTSEEATERLKQKQLASNCSPVVCPVCEAVLVMLSTLAGIEAVPTSTFCSVVFAVIWKTLLIDDAWGLKLTVAAVVAGSATKRILAIISKTITINTGMIVRGDNLNP